MLDLQLNKESEYLNSIFDSIFDEIVILDKDYTINAVNKTFCLTYGVSKDEAIGSKCYKLTHGSNKICKPPECKCPVEDALKTGKLSESVHYHHVEGKEMYIELLAYPIRNDNGEISQIIKVGRDITEKTKNEQKIRELKDEFRLITSSAKDAIIMIDNSGKITFWNKAAETIFGYTSKEVLSKNIDSLFECNYYYEVFIKGLAEFKKSSQRTAIGKTLELSCIKKDGTEFPIEISISAVKINNKWTSIAIIRDITTRKLAEQELKKSLKSTSKILELLPMGIIIIGYDKKIRVVNTIALTMLGADNEDEIIGKICHNNICPAQNGACPILDLGQNVDNSEKILLNSNGKKVPILKSVIPITLAGENLLLEAFADITPLKETQLKLVESEIKLKTLNDRLEQKVMVRTYDLGERIKELSCLFDISKIVQQPNIMVEEAFQKIINRVPSSMQYPEITCARITFYDQEFKTKNFKEMKWKLSSDIITGSKKIGNIEIIYLNEKPKRDEGPFFREERELINAIAEILGRFIEHSWMEKKIQESEKKYRDLYENSPYAIVILNMEGKIVDCNSKLQELTGYSKNEIINNILEDSLSFSQSSFNEIYEALIEGNIIEPYENITKTKNGKTLWAHLSFSLINFGNEKLIHMLIQDITELKRSEQEVEKLSQTLTTVSHELRTPLNAILGLSSLLLDDAFGKTNETQKDYLNEINNAGDHLLKVINCILDLSQIEAGKFKLNKEEFNLSKLLLEICSLVKPLYEKKGLNFIFEGIDDTISLIADPLRFKRLLLNLIDNAIKYTEKGNIIFRGIEKKDHWEFHVEDTGMGIAEEDKDIIFREFGRIENDKIKHIAGTGLGLTFVKKIIELHGGEIWFESEIGKGTTFFFTMPKLSIQNKSHLK